MEELTKMQEDAERLRMFFANMSKKALEFLCDTVAEHELRYQVAYRELLRRQTGYVDLDWVATLPTSELRQAALRGIQTK